MTGLTARQRRKRRSAVVTRRILSALAATAPAAALLLVLGPDHARARTSAAAWHTCTRQATHHVGIYEDDNDHFTGMPGTSCITVTGHGTRIRIDRNYKPHGDVVVAYDAIRIGEYPYNRDPGSGLPARVSKLKLTLHETASGGPGTYLYDDDIWFSRTAAADPLLHIREIIIANQRQNFDPRRGDDAVKIGRRRWFISRGYTGSGGRSWPLIRFVARRRASRVTIHLAAFLHIARRHHWISDAMNVDSVSYAPEVWSGGRGLTYSMVKKSRRRR